MLSWKWKVETVAKTFRDTNLRQTHILKLNLPRNVMKMDLDEGFPESNESNSVTDMYNIIRLMVAAIWGSRSRI